MKYQRELHRKWFHTCLSLQQKIKYCDKHCKNHKLSGTASANLVSIWISFICIFLQMVFFSYQIELILKSYILIKKKQIIHASNVRDFLPDLLKFCILYWYWGYLKLELDIINTLYHHTWNWHHHNKYHSVLSNTQTLFNKTFDLSQECVRLMISFNEYLVNVAMYSTFCGITYWFRHPTTIINAKTNSLTVFMLSFSTYLSLYFSVCVWNMG